MDRIKVVPEDLQSKFKSKADLYELLSIDLRYYLPPFEKCPMHFLRSVLARDKKVIRKEKVIEIEVPRYNELAVSKIWPFVKDVPDLVQYFPEYKDSQLPDRSLMFCILSTLRFAQIKNMVTNARKYRSDVIYENDNQLVHVTKALFDEIIAVVFNKLKKGKATQMLKRSTKLVYNRKPAKTYPLSMENLNNEEEKQSHEDEME